MNNRLLLIRSTVCATARLGRPSPPLRLVFSAQPQPHRAVSSSSSGYEWRQLQLDKLQRKFDEPKAIIESPDELQQMWRDMEGRVTKRRLRTVEEMGGKTGRTNIKRTDEEIWLKEGLYEEQDKKEK